MAKRRVRTRQSFKGQLNNKKSWLNKKGYRILKMLDDETFEQKSWRLGQRRTRISD